MEIISEFRPLLLMQSTSTVLVTNSTHFNSGSCISEGYKEVFWNHDQHWKLFYYSSKIAAALKGVQAVLVFSELKIVKASDT